MKPLFVRLPHETGEMLRTLTKAARQPASDVLASLIVAQGENLGLDLPIPGVAITHKTDGVHVVFDGLALAPMSPQNLLSFADTVESVLNGRAEEMLDLDGPDIVRVRRVGAGFALTITRAHDVTPYRRVFSKGVMRALQAKLRAAAKRAAIYG